MSIETESSNLYDSIDEVCDMAENFWGNVELNEVQERAMRLVVKSLKNAMQLVDSLPRIEQMNADGIRDLYDTIDEAMHRVSELVEHEHGLSHGQKLLLKAAKVNLRSAIDHVERAFHAK